MNSEQNEIISLPRLIQLISDKTGCEATEARKFLHEFFALTEECLVQGQSVRVKGIGTFNIADKNSGDVVFCADAELADAVNTPFAMFEPVELGNVSPEDFEASDKPEAVEFSENDGGSITEDIDYSEKKGDTVPPDENITESEEEEYVLTIDEDIANETDEKDSYVCVTTENEDENTVDEFTTVEPAKQYVDSITEAEDGNEAAGQLLENRNNHSRKYLIRYSAIAIVALIIGLSAGFYIGKRNNITAVNNITDTEQAADRNISDNIEIDEQSISIPDNDNTATGNAVDKKNEVFDTVSANHYLATMARRHYGRMEYWVYIYETNPGLGHPDRIKPGTIVRIPDKSEFSQNNDSATLSKALKLYSDIYNRFQ